MSRAVFRLILAVSGSVLWIAVVLVASLQGRWREPLAPRGDTLAFLSALEQSVPESFRGNLIATLVEAGVPVGNFVVGPNGAEPDMKSVFQVASLSKWVTAVGVLTLIDDGVLTLDDPVSLFLTRWRLPEGSFSKEAVTVRRLLSHTAGLTDGLGYNGFANADDLQTLEESLTRAADAMPGASGIVHVELEPGTRWQYSGGGYTLLQLLIEEVTGMSFSDYMSMRVFLPTGMFDSSYTLDTRIRNRLVTFYEVDGTVAKHFHYTATGAASLYTTALDMTRFLHALSIPAESGGLLSDETLNAMRAPEGHVFGLPIWGLGVTRFIPGESTEAVVGHDGRNQPAINTTARLNPRNGDGIVVLSTGTTNLATNMGADWIYWQTGKTDITDIARHGSRVTIPLLVGLTIIWMLLFRRFLVSRLCDKKDA